MESLISPSDSSFRSSSFIEPRRPLELEPFANSCEAFLVDELFDFSNDDISSPSGDNCATYLRFPAENSAASTPLDSFGIVPSERCSSRAPPSVLEIVTPSAEPLYTPPDELAELDWLSPFTEEVSFAADEILAPFVHSNYSDNNIVCGRDDSGSFLRKSPVSVLEENHVFCTRPRNILGSTTVVKGRSKRARTAGRVWSLQMLPPLPSDRNIADEKPVYEDSSEDSQSSSLEYEAGEIYRPKKKLNKNSHAKKGSLDNSPTRRCTHCQVQKTPQWRAGPSGPKTLCNACGVRYKSGRLVPEYRPAASPSFVGEIHSNSHKKILEMRQYKDQEVDDVEPSAGLDHETFIATSDLSEELDDFNSFDQTMTSSDIGDEAQGK